MNKKIRFTWTAVFLISSAHAAGIDDSHWNEIAGSHINDNYEIQKGDTLWDISKRLFGNPHYWPKIWSLNNSGANITNPHIVDPGQKLAFKPGTAETLPSVAPTTQSADASTPAPAPVVAGDHVPEFEKVSQDLWKPLELKIEDKKVDYDEYGIEKEIKIIPQTKLALRVPVIANETTLPYLGEVVGSRREGVGLSQNEVIFLKSENQDLQVGTTYSVLSDAIYVSESKSDRSGYVYRANGEVKIVGIKDGTYIGIITKGYDVIRRGDRIYPLLPTISEIKPVASIDDIEALVILNPLISTWSTAQYHFVHLDRGLEDGVQVGNIFRIFEYYDPQTKEKLTDSDIMVNADAIVVHATGQFSTALVINSRGVIHGADFGVALKDVSSFDEKKKDFGREFGQPGEKKDDAELDELDALDHASDNGLGKKEEQEVKELEHWDRNKPADAPKDDLDPDNILSPDATPEPQPVEPAAPAVTPEASAPEMAAPEAESATTIQDSAPSEPDPTLDSKQ